VLLAVLALRALLPFAVKWGLEWQGTRSLGRNVHVGDVDLGLFAGHVSVEGLDVGPILEPGTERAAEPDPASSILRASRIDANLEWGSLLQGPLRLATVQLTEPQVQVVIAPNGRLVPLVSPYLARTEGAPEPAQEALAEAEAQVVEARVAADDSGSAGSPSREVESTGAVVGSVTGTVAGTAVKSVADTVTGAALDPGAADAARGEAEAKPPGEPPTATADAKPST